MPNQTIPITLTWGPTAGRLSDYDLNQLGTLIAAQLAAAIRADVTFIPQVTNDPGAYEGQLIFNVPQNVFKSWNIGAGAYLSVTENTIGDIKDSFNANDDLAHGWVVLNGRLLTDITGLSATQLVNLQSLFGATPTTTLPTVSATHTSGLPAGSAFSSIPWPPSLAPVVQPAAGIISPGLTFSNPVADTEAQALANETEILRTSVQDSFDVTKQIQAVAQQMLTALNNATTPPIYAKVFAGYPA